MYTSFSPNNERFGFSMKGKFKCAYKNERVFLIAGLSVAVLLIIAFIISIIDFGALFNPNGSIKGGLGEISMDPHSDHRFKTNNNFVKFGVGLISFDFFFFVFLILVIANIVLITIMKSGIAYSFEANEECMKIIFPDGKEETIMYSDVMAVKDKERKTLYGSRGLDVTVKTRYGDYYYRLIHTPMSKANGITETPFNIVRERAELTEKWQRRF